MYFLDTNTCIYFLNGRYENLRSRIFGTSPAEIKIASVVKAELLLGAEKSNNRSRTLDRVEKFLDPFEIIPFDDQSSYAYARVRAKTERAGNTVGPNDLIIASVVLFHEGTLVTNNSRELSVIDGLKLENWI